VQPLINEFVAAGFSVQLNHVTTETSWEDTDEHGFVLLKFAGKDVVRKGGFQHNRNLRKGGSWDASAVQELCKAVIAASNEKADDTSSVAPKEKADDTSSETTTIATAA